MVHTVQSQPYAVQSVHMVQSPGQQTLNIPLMSIPITKVASVEILPNIVEKG